MHATVQVKSTTANGNELPVSRDVKKAEAAAVFRAMWDRVEKDPVYRALRQKARTNGNKRHATINRNR